ncbi:hypothetical protein Bca4012_005895 [Brassica carinata]|uniref:BnaC03g74730D protein n=3 Tax=Brassica TaxID=3705 RepID=A0A078J302_BRANA|nr:uncharacterized protein LOC106405761 [Brassica napus]KAG2293166.1 hypothetical protein Bca52824_039835 [Brassica carinata]CDY57911.1 BnaC03g74730D [Brassica napus]VDC96103.1 unnamed protein product [Brassica oleracea]
MAHSSSSSTIEYKNDKSVVCNFNRLANIVQAWTDDNPGRRFYSCKGRRVGNRYDSCNFFDWYDEEKPHGWQYVALLGARDVMRKHKEEIKILRNKVRELAIASERIGENLTDSKQTCEACKACEELEKEVLILNERSTVYRNVLIASSIGLTMVLGVFVGMMKW